MRSKTRRRILYAAAGLSIAALASVALFRHRGARRLAVATERFESEVGVLNPLAYAPPDLPDDENAAHWLRQGVATLALSAADRAALGDFWQRDDEIPSPAVVDLLARNARAVEHFQRAGERTQSSWGVRYAAGPVPTMPDLTGPLEARRLLLADARAGLAAGDLWRALADARALVALRRALRREPAFLFQIVATAVEPAHHRLVADLLASELVDAAQLAELAGQLDPGEAERSLRAAIAVEASWLAAWEPRSSAAPAPWGRLRQAAARLWALRQSAAGIDLYRRLALAAGLPATQVADFVQPQPAADGLAVILVPNLIDGVEKHRAAAAARRLAGLALELRLHALRHGRYPETLAGTAAVDAPDPYAGGALRYEVRPDGAAVVAYPDAEVLWRRKNPHWHLEPRFAWTLPRA